MLVLSYVFSALNKDNENGIIWCDQEGLVKSSSKKNFFLKSIWQTLTLVEKGFD